MAIRAKRSGCLVLVALASSLALLGETATAAVVCQKGPRIKLRAAVCRPNEAQIGAIGGEDPSGIWEHTAGTLFDDRGLEPRFLVLDRDGAGRLNLGGGDGGVLTCASLHYAIGANQALTIDVSRFGDLRVYRYQLAGSSGLTLTDSTGRSGSFVRASAVDPAAECGELTETGRFAGLPRPEYASGLAFDGTSLWYEESGTQRILPVDPASGSVGTPVTLVRTQYTHVHAAAGGDFWTHCFCGGSEEAARVTPASAVVDEVHTGSGLGAAINVSAIAFDPAAGDLWLHGSNNDGQGRLLQVDAGGEPDVLLAAFELDAWFSGLAFDGVNLWALAPRGPSVVRIDPATGQATGNFRIPTSSAEWKGIAVVGNELVLLGEAGTSGILLKVATPAP